MHGVHGSSDLRSYVSNSGAVLTSGKVGDLATDQIGFFRVDKRGVGIPDQAQAAPTVKTSPTFKLGIGRAPYQAQSAIQPIESTFPWLTREIKGRNIVKWEGIKADPTSHTEIWTVGYDGVDASKRLSAKIDYHELIISIRLWGGPIQKLTGGLHGKPGVPWIRRHYHIDKGCIDKCLDVCDTNPGLADEYIADEFLKKFNADFFSGNGSNIPISRFVKAVKLRKPADAETPITTVGATQYTFSLCDDGSNSALGVVQAQYPGYKVVKEGRIGAISTYSMWRPDADGAPASFVNTAPIALAVCNTCPSGYTLVEEQDVYTIQRPVAAGTDLTTDAAKQTYANTIGSAYAASERGVTGVALSAGGTGYTNGTFPLVFAGGGGSGAAGTITVTGGVAQTPVVTSKGYGYTSAPTVTAPAVTGGTGLGTLTASISAAPTATSTFVSYNGSTATVNVSFDGDVRTLPALGSDVIVASNTSSAYCTPPAGASIAWVAGLERTIAPKQWMLTLEDDTCGNSRLAELQAAYPDLVIAEQGTTGECARVYTTTNYSDPFITEECSPSQYVYHKPDAFFTGAEWVEFVTPLVTPVCTTTEEPTPCVAAGIKFETAAFHFTTGECLYGYHQYSIDDVDPVYMEVTATANTVDWTASPCDKTNQIVTKLRGTKFATGRGVFIREFEDATLYQYGKTRSTNLARNEAYGYYHNTKPELWYDTYKLTVEQNESQHGIIGREGSKQRITYSFHFPSGMGKTFESLINGYVLSLDNEDLLPVIL